MKELSLKKIISLHKLNIDKDYIIKYVTNDITKIANDTLVYHITREDELNYEAFYQLSNCFIITDQPILNDKRSDNFLFVTDVNKAYSEFTTYYRSLFNIPVVAITGTCGKTTTKEMITQVLRNKYQVAATVSNKNHLNYNHDYLMSIDDNTKFGVFETAISAPGYLITGCNIFKPTIGIITTIGVDHLNGCKTLDNYIKTKGEMLAGLNYQGTLIINSDDENIKKINMTHYKGKVITFGIKEKADFFGYNIKYLNNSMAFTFIYDNNKYDAFIPGLGEHNVLNALAAIACLIQLGVNIHEIIYYLHYFKHLKNHCEVKQGINESTIIDDSWSSNPTSIEASLKVLSNLGKNKTKLAVFGKISYLGDYVDHYYNKIAQTIINEKIDFFISIDSFAKQIGKNLMNNGFPKNRIIHCKDEKELISTLETLLDSKSLVLFKTSMLDKSSTNIIKNLTI